MRPARIAQYRLVMPGRLGRRLRGCRSVADGDTIAITVDEALPQTRVVTDPELDDGSHTPPHGDVSLMRA